MTLEEAIKTAINYETKVRDLYKEAADKATDEAGRKVFSILGDEEQGHLDYLASRYKEWKESGHVKIEALGTVIPDKEKIAQGIRTLGQKVEGADYSEELDLLKRALQMEKDTGEFYQRMVRELDDEGQRLFERFVEIEEGHYAIVQAQIDALTGMGFWFDSMEFNLENA